MWDYSWIKDLKYEFKNYLGVDIVDELIKENNLKYSNAKIRFICLDIITDEIPKAD